MGLLKFLSKKRSDVPQTIGMTIVTMVTNSVSTQLHTDYSYTHYSNMILILIIHKVIILYMLVKGEVYHTLNCRLDNFTGSRNHSKTENSSENTAKVRF